ncbi:MAG TPA: hypothetical protein VFD70_29585 [Anaerolineae bacterium]|nr:hypothetical protein [Anaerolineae bacterium]
MLVAVFIVTPAIRADAESNPSPHPRQLTRLAPSDASGWAKTYGNSTGHELAVSLAPTSDGGYVLAGYSILQSGVEGRLWKVNSSGNLAWQKAYTGSNQEPINSIAATADGGYIAVGNTNFGAGSTDAWILKTASQMRLFFLCT